MELTSRLPWRTSAATVKGRPMTSTPAQTQPRAKEDGGERRAPDRHLVAVRLMRGVATIALSLSAVLWVAPRILVEMGMLGPDSEESIQAADRSLSLARSYGATDVLAPVQAAQSELAHIERFDCLTQFVALLACAVYWFNPLAWMAAHRMRVEVEPSEEDGSPR